MTSSITFETAAIADVIKKATKIAPSKGAAFDKANGILIEFDPSGGVPLAVVRSTNLDIFCMEWVTVHEMSGEPARWRLPHVLLGLVVASLPIGTDKTVTFTSEVHPHGYTVHMKSGRTKAKFIPLDPELFPTWAVFDPDHMFPATDLGGRIAMVEWAASRSQPEISGVYLDGEIAAATDSYRLAVVPLSIPDLKEAVVVPSGLLGQTLRETGDVQVGVEGNFLNIMPDEYTQMRAILMATKYPNLSKVIDTVYDTEVKVDQDHFMEIMRRVNAFSLGDRTSAFRIFFGKEQIAIYMTNDAAGNIGDVIEVPGYATHEKRLELKFTPKNIMEAVEKAPNRDLTLSYNSTVERTTVRIDGGSGYKAWVMPRLGLSEPKDD